MRASPATISAKAFYSRAAFCEVMNIDLDAALADLQKLVDRIAELIQWAKLARRERRPFTPPSFQLQHHVVEDIDGLINSGWYLDREIREALARPDLAASPEQRRRWTRRLEQLERSVTTLTRTARYIRK